MKSSRLTGMASLAAAVTLTCLAPSSAADTKADGLPAQKPEAQKPQGPIAAPSLPGSELFPPGTTVAGLVSWKAVANVLPSDALAQLRAMAMASFPVPVRTLLATLDTIDAVGGFSMSWNKGFALLARGSSQAGAGTPPVDAAGSLRGRRGDISYAGQAEAVEALVAHLEGGANALRQSAIGAVLGRLTPTSLAWFGAVIPPGMKPLLTHLTRALAPAGAVDAPVPDRFAVGLAEIGSRAELRVVAEFPSSAAAYAGQNILEKATQTALLLLPTLRPAPQDDDHAVALDAARALTASLLRSVHVSIDGKILEATLVSPFTLARTAQTLSRALLPIFTVYLNRSKAAEARISLQRIVRLAADHLRTLPRDPRGFVDPRALPSPAPRTPEATACDFPGQRFPASADRFKHPTWRAIGFSITDPHYYRYELDLRMDGPTLHILAIASGDLDCNGVFSRYQQAATLDKDGELKLEPQQVHSGSGGR